MKLDYIFVGGGIIVAAILIRQFCCGAKAIPVIPPLDITGRGGGRTGAGGEVKAGVKPQPRITPQTGGKGGVRPTQDLRASGKPSILDEIGNFFKPLTDAVKGFKPQDPFAGPLEVP